MQVHVLEALVHASHHLIMLRLGLYLSHAGLRFHAFDLHHGLRLLASHLRFALLDLHVHLHRLDLRIWRRLRGRLAGLLRQLADEVVDALLHVASGAVSARHKPEHLTHKLGGFRRGLHNRPGRCQQPGNRRRKLVPALLLRVLVRLDRAVRSCLEHERAHPLVSQKAEHLFHRYGFTRQGWKLW